MKLIQVLGPGCTRCQTLAENTKQAAKQIGLKCNVVKVTDRTAIKQMGVLMTPGLAIDGKIVSAGRVPTVDELVKLLGK